jgi:hypothetical protein
MLLLLQITSYYIVCPPVQIYNYCLMHCLFSQIGKKEVTKVINTILHLSVLELLLVFPVHIFSEYLVSLSFSIS